MNKTVDRDVSAVDVTDEASVSRMLENLRSEGEQLRRVHNKRNAFLKVWDDIVGSSGDWKVYESKAAALDVSDDTRNLRDVLAANAGVREKFMKKSFEEIGVMREDLINRRSFKDRVFRLNAEQEVILGGSADSAKFYNVTASQKAALNDIPERRKFYKQKKLKKMYQYKNINQGVIKYNKSYVGERLEEKIQRITSNESEDPKWNL